MPEDGYPGDYLLDLMAARKGDLQCEVATAFGYPDLARGDEKVPALVATLTSRGQTDEAMRLVGRRAAEWLLEQIKETGAVA